MRPPKQREDPTTELLAELLRADAATLHLFLRFLFADGAQANSLARLPLRIDTQHIIPNGRLDLLIHHRSVAIIVECKVNDGQRVYQLQKYHAHWRGLHRAEPHIFWLVRRNTASLGLNPYLAAEWRWDELHTYFQRHSDRLSSKAKGDVNEFCQYLQEAEILLLPGERSIRQVRGRGYDYGYAERLLDSIASRFKDASFEVTPPMNGVTHRLFIGRQTWASKFEDKWIRRVVLQLKPRDSGGSFFWHGNIMLYNRHDIPDPTFAIKMLPRWAPICKEAGFRLLRNLGANWNGKYSYEIEFPYLIARPVKYFHAPLPDEVWPAKTFQLGDEEAALAEGVRMMHHMYKVVDQF